MSAQERGSRIFSLSFVENINTSLSKSRGLNRRARIRAAAIRSLMIINKSDLEIQSDLQAAFAKVTHEARQ
jgi:hypothetical protein